MGLGMELAIGFASIGCMIGILLLFIFLGWFLFETDCGHLVMLIAVVWFVGAMIFAILAALVGMLYLWDNILIAIFIPLVIGGILLRLMLYFDEKKLQKDRY